MAKRRHLVCRLSETAMAAEAALATELDVLSHPEPTHPERLGALLFEAYLGGIEQEENTVAEGVEEVRRTMTGSYGPFLPEMSFVLEEESVVMGATLIVKHNGSPMLAHALTHPQVRGRGVATRLIYASIRALHAAGEQELHLAVHGENADAVHLYEKLGFVDYIEFPGISRLRLTVRKNGKYWPGRRGTPRNRRSADTGK